MSGKGAVGSGGNIKLKPETLPEDKIKTFCQKWLQWGAPGQGV